VQPQEIEKPKLARTKSNYIEPEQINLDFYLQGIKSINELINENRHN
jgi:hypothetical protein